MAPSAKKSADIDNIIGRLTIEQKIGQCLVLGFVGTRITPKILERIKRYCPAGIRAGLTFRIKTALHDPYATSEKFAHRVLRNPVDTVKDVLPGIAVPHCTNEEYCAFLNVMKRAALNNDAGVPLHITFDMEGDVSADYARGGIRYFPSCMGLARTKDTSLVQRVAQAICDETIPLGFSWIHSPVVDVNSTPLNPEIGVRAYGETAAQVSEYVLAAFKGFQKGGLITTGKHFPGRGHSTGDAHHGLPEIGLTRKEMDEHLAPYRTLIEAGLPCIMSAHSAYPHLDPSGMAASLSKPILTDLLKGELGFKGVISTDDITMGGIVEKFDVLDACIHAINAGNDLILFRDESPLIDEVVPGLVQAVKDGRIKESRLDDAIRRTLTIKEEYGMFNDGGVKDEKRASDGINSKDVRAVAKEAAQRVVSVLRDDANLLPLKKDTKVLLVEQINPLHMLTNSQDCHPGQLWDEMLAISDNVIQVETSMDHNENDQKRVLARINEADVIVATNYYFRRSTSGNDFVKKLHTMGKSIIVVTNTPYPFAVQPEYKSVVLCYGSSPECMRAIAHKLYNQPNS